MSKVEEFLKVFFIRRISFIDFLFTRKVLISNVCFTLIYFFTELTKLYLLIVIIAHLMTIFYFYWTTDLNYLDKYEFQKDEKGKELFLFNFINKYKIRARSTKHKILLITLLLSLNEGPLYASFMSKAIDNSKETTNDIIETQDEDINTFIKTIQRKSIIAVQNIKKTNIIKKINSKNKTKYDLSINENKINLIDLKSNVLEMNTNKGIESEIK